MKLSDVEKCIWAVAYLFECTRSERYEREWVREQESRAALPAYEQREQFREVARGYAQAFADKAIESLRAASKALEAKRNG